ncbi:MAG: hypothetical protein IJU54_02345 [Alphaproteobacteria bacterium]|nr:hypothetical protein [Alphaproteobacteria bacterium]
MILIQIINRHNTPQNLLLQLNNSNNSLSITSNKPIIPYNNNCCHSEYQAAKKNYRTGRNHCRLDKVIESINNEISDDEIDTENITKKPNNTINIISPSKTISNNSINNNIFSASENSSINTMNLPIVPHKIFNSFNNIIGNNTVQTTNNDKTTIIKEEKIISPNENITQKPNSKCKENDNNIKTPVIQNKSFHSSSIMNTNDTTPHNNNNADINNDNTNLQDSNNITSDKKNISKNLLFTNFQKIKVKKQVKF